jgi:hypothetical protein
MDTSLMTLLGVGLAVWVATGFRGVRLDWLKRGTGLENRMRLERSSR